MRTQVWDLLVNTKYDEIYAQLYRKRICFWDKVLSGVTLFASAASIAAWWIWSQYPVLYSIILGAAQLVQVFKPLFPFSSHLLSLRRYVPELKDLVIDIEKFWNRQGDFSGCKCANQLSELRKKRAAIDNKWFGDERFPDWESIKTESWKECRQYMASYGAITEGDEFDAYNTKANPATTSIP